MASPTLSTLTNLFPTLILRSPLHRLMSRHYALLQMTGRRSGRIITIPVAYVRRRGSIIVSSDSPWRVNVVASRPVRILVAGRWLDGVGRRVVDRAEAAGLLGQLAEQVPGYCRPAGLTRVGGRVPAAELARAVRQDRWVIELGEA